MRCFALTLFLFASAVAFAQQPVQKIGITHLTKNFYVCTSYGYPDGKNPYPANSLFAVTSEGIILIDTPWGDEQTQQLLDAVRKRFNKKIVLCISTHFHDDRIGGVDMLKKTGIKTYSSKQTYILAQKEGNNLPQYTFSKDTTFTVGGIALQTYYPGAGHTSDNLVVWFPQQKILFGGCLVKSTAATTKGNVVDADLQQWPVTIKRLRARFKKAEFIIPGHEGWQGGLKQLDHTLQILSN
jgi:metallo-beta-lactamase class B